MLETQNKAVLELHIHASTYTYNVVVYIQGCDRHLSNLFENKIINM